jgi:hypothetical protein
MLRIPFLLLIPILLAGSLHAQTNSQKAAVELNAAVQRAPARITLSWTALPSTTSISVFRKLATASSWGSAIANPSASAVQYEDNSVVAGTAYEYRVVRVAGGVTGQGYISTGIDIQLSAYKGKMILLVDNTFTSSLSSELAQLTKDLRADGWAVLRSDVGRTASVSSVRNAVIAHYNSDPTNVKAVYIIGHVPVPYSGNINPDGHSEHQGAWPCDGYYGEMNGTWTDNSVNNNAAQRSANRNVPGDGKFDQSTFPSSVELQVGRVDLFDMPAFGQNETELLRAYLNKAHNFKVKLWTPQQRGLIYDNLQWVSNPLGASAWRNIAPMVGAANTTAPNIYMGDFNTLINGQSYLWTYGSGGGLQATDGGVLTFNGGDRLGTTQTYAAMSGGGVFNMSMGSYFGDWDNRNNFLKAPIAGGSGLTSCWVGIPAWYFHHMGMGQNIGLSTWYSMNNTAQYTPLTDGWQGSMGTTHLGLMGDPSLRQKMLVPPSNLTVTNASGMAAFAWNASPETVDGYHLYRFNANGSITQLTTAIVTGTTYSNGAVPYSSGTEYMVRGVKLEVAPSGSYYNLSLGAIATASGAAAAADCQGVAGGSALPGTPCNDGNACTTNDTWTASCQCVGTNSTPVAVITPAGSVGFCAGGSVVLNATTGAGYTYIWKRNGTTISGAAGSSYTATLAGSYTVTITSNTCVVVSNAQVVNVGALPVATLTAAGPTTFCPGGSVTLNANTGSGLTYQWRRNDVVITGATSSSYSATTAGSYMVVVISAGCASSSSVITVSVNSSATATLTASGPTSFCTGGSVVLSTLTGAGNAYLWKRNGTTISGATASTYSATQAGSYTATVTSTGCTATSSAVSVTVVTPPTASLSAGGITAFCSGSSLVLNANTGSGYTYSWSRNGAVISGASSSSYTATIAGSYSVTVSSGSCSATSPAVTITTYALPTASCSSNATNSTVSVVPSGGLAPYSVNWNTSPAQTSTSASVSASGSYTATVTDARGCTTSCTTSITLSSGSTCSGTRTESQIVWGAPASGSSPSAYMTSNFATAFPASNYLSIGCGWRKLRLTSASAVIAFLPSSGSAAQLPWGTKQNPGSSYGNSFAGELVALKLSVRFDELAPAFNPSPVLLKNMIIASGTFAGWTVQQLITSADAKIGGCYSAYSRDQLHVAVAAVNAGYLGGTMNSGYLVCPGPAGMVLQDETENMLILEEEKMVVSVFPNPANEQATLVINGTEKGSPTIVAFYALSGIQVSTMVVAEGEHGIEQRVALDVSDLAPGIYFYKVISGERSAAGRIAVE